MLDRQNTRLDTQSSAFLRLLGLPIKALGNLLSRKPGQAFAKIWQAQTVGKYNQSRPIGAVAWVHAYSSSEINAAKPFIHALTMRGFKVILTSRSMPENENFEVQIANEFEGNVIYQAAPTDLLLHANKFLRYWKPNIAFFADKEIWPNMLTRLANKKINAFLVNARLSEDAFDYWLQRADQAFEILKKTRLICAQNIEYLDRFEALGAPNVIDTGNFRFDTVPSLPDPQELANLKRMIGARPVFLAANTHPGEEQIIARVHLALRPHLPKLLTIIVPRSPERADAISGMLDSELVKTCRRSHGQPIEAHHDIYLGDTYGELPLFYSTAGFAFIGGSLSEVGGHNPIEAVQYHCAALFGPHTYNFSNICDRLIKDGGALRIPNAKALGRQVFFLLADPKRSQKIQQAAKQSLQSQEGAMHKTMRVLEPHLAQILVDEHLKQTRIES